MNNRVWKIGAGGLLAGLCAAVFAQTSPNAQSIYTCVDKQGRKLTSDRPIPECIDREQRELGPSGTLRRVIGPTLTQQEREALAEGGQVAKRLNFLFQEMHREVNTMGSKTQNLEITRAVIAMKDEVESLREQIQNLE